MNPLFRFLFIFTGGLYLTLVILNTLEIRDSITRSVVALLSMLIVTELVRTIFPLKDDD